MKYQIIISLFLTLCLREVISLECDFTKYIVSKVVWDKIHELIPSDEEAKEEDSSAEMAMIDKVIEKDLDELKVTKLVPCNYVNEELRELGSTVESEQFDLNNIKKLLDATVIIMQPFSNSVNKKDQETKFIKIRDVTDIKHISRHSFKVCSAKVCENFSFKIFKQIDDLNSMVFLKYYLYFTARELIVNGYNASRMREIGVMAQEHFTLEENIQIQGLLWEANHRHSAVLTGSTAHSPAQTESGWLLGYKIFASKEEFAPNPQISERQFAVDILLRIANLIDDYWANIHYFALYTDEFNFESLRYRKRKLK
jgi:hypothetical protein